MDATLVALRRKPGAIQFEWSDGVERALEDRALRLACPCAFCVHELTGRRLLEPAQVPGQVKIRDMQPVGNYAYRILFDDGHDTGIYTLERLRGLCGDAAAGP
jgi:ATP-binding protein involved in chromosome partitioning